MPEHNTFLFSKSKKVWDLVIQPGNYTIGGLFKVSNLSGGYHGILKQWWDYYSPGPNVLLISENNKVKSDFQKVYPNWNIVTIDNYPEISTMNDVDVKGDICSETNPVLGKFDIIINQATIEHVYNPFQAMKNLVHSLNDGGILLTHTHPPNQEYHQYPRDYFRFMIDWWVDLPKYIDDIELLELYMHNNAHVFSCYQKKTMKVNQEIRLACFSNDNNISLLLIDHEFSNNFSKRDAHEVLFRRLNTFLINNNIIKNNIIDLGAWIGDNTLPWSKNIKGIVYAIDPSADNCEFIRNMCIKNNIENVKVIQSAISNKNETLFTKENINHCSFVYNNTDNTGNNKADAVSLDYLYQTKSIENIGYIHLDVEGMEFKVIEGSVSLIDANRPIISFEQHLELDDYKGIIVFLVSKEYSVFLIDEILPGCRHDCKNFIAFPNEVYSEQMIQNIHRHIGSKLLVKYY